MSMVDEYISRANETLRDGDPLAIDSIAREIVVAFHSSIPNLSHYRGTRAIGCGPNYHTATDLKNLIGKLRVFQEARDAELYSEYGLMAITDSIRQLQNAIAEDYTEDQFAKLFDKIDNIYANRYESYAVGLCGYYSSDDAADESQAQLRTEKLRVFRDEELRKFKLAQFQSAPVNITQSQSQEAQAAATSIIIGDLSNTYERIDEIPENELSDNDKLKLKGLLAELEQAKQKDASVRKGRIQKVLTFLADKGADAAIAAAPYIGAVAQQLF